MKTTITGNTSLAQFMTPSEVLEHWQAHRRLTRKVIAAFPEETLTTYSLGGMRSFGTMAMELLAIAGPGIKEIATGETVPFTEEAQTTKTKTEILELWDEATVLINTYWQQIPPERFHEVIKSFGEYEGTVYSAILYFMDNEIHHRGQGYVYLRSLGIEPPLFYERD